MRRTPFDAPIPHKSLVQELSRIGDCRVVVVCSRLGDSAFAGGGDGLGSGRRRQSCAQRSRAAVGPALLPLERQVADVLERGACELGGTCAVAGVEEHVGPVEARRRQHGLRADRGLGLDGGTEVCFRLGVVAAEMGETAQEPSGCSEVHHDR